MTPRAAIAQSLAGLRLAAPDDTPRCEECRAALRDGARATGLAVREHEAAAFSITRLWCIEHTPGEIPEPTRAREQVLFQADVGAACDVGAQAHWPIPIAPEVCRRSPIERVVADGGIIVGGRNERGDDAEILHDETGRYGDDGEPRDHDLAEFAQAND